MNLSSVSTNQTFLAQSLLFDRPLVMEDRRPSPETPSFPSERTLASSEAVTQKIEEIADNPNLTDKEKRAQINDLRKQLGISKGEMKKHFTKPLERAYARKIEQLKMSGIDTPEKARLLEQLESKKKLYNSMYKAGGCVKKVFKGIGKGLATVGKVALGVASAIANPMSLIPVIGQIPMVGKVVNAVTGAFSKAKSAVDGVVGKVTGWVDQGISTYQRGLDIYRRASELPRRWLDEARGIFWGE